MRRRNRNWIWFFVALLVLGLTAIGINLGYNLGEPLTLEQLQAARSRWKSNRPPNYDLRLSIAHSNGAIRNKYEVQIREGLVTGFLINGTEPDRLLSRDGAPLLEEERRRREMYDIDGLFDSIEDLMSQDRSAGRQSFMRARFDKKTGYPLIFTRQFQRRKEQQIRVEMKVVEPKS